MESEEPISTGRMGGEEVVEGVVYARGRGEPVRRAGWIPRGEVGRGCAGWW